MKSLKSYLTEDGEAVLMATPGNTIGMGNPQAPADGVPGSEPLNPKKKKNCKKSLKMPNNGDKCKECNK